jgi:NTE family protein
MSTVKPKVGLVLGGGYARGLAHIGVLEVLETAGVPIDIITGTSMGALIGALYAHEKEAAILRHQATQLEMVSLASLIDLKILKSGLFAGKKIINRLKRLMGDLTFEELDIPFACIATDIISGEEVVMNKGKVLEAVRASISIPVIFTVVKKDGRFLVDGGLVNNVPVSVARKMGADYVIAVDVTPTAKERADHLLQDAEVKEPSILNVMVQSLYITTSQSLCGIAANADVVIHPKLADVNPADFHKARECILAGELAATDIVMHIKKDLADFDEFGTR